MAAKTKKTIKLNALVVNGMNPIYMTGASKFALKLQNKGLDLADCRLVNSKTDMVNTDLLVGTDYYDEIVPPYITPIQTLGMWLKHTQYGQ